MRFLLDENFPLRLLRELRARDIECDHIIDLGLRGIRDADIIDRVEREPDLVLLTQDGDFEDVPLRSGRAVVSRIPQGLPLRRRVDLWVRAIEALTAVPSPGSAMEITATGELRVLRE